MLNSYKKLSSFLFLISFLLLHANASFIAKAVHIKEVIDDYYLISPSAHDIQTAFGISVNITCKGLERGYCIGYFLDDTNLSALQNGKPFAFAKKDTGLRIEMALDPESVLFNSLYLPLTEKFFVLRLSERQPLGSSVYFEGVITYQDDPTWNGRFYGTIFGVPATVLGLCCCYYFCCCCVCPCCSTCIRRHRDSGYDSKHQHSSFIDYYSRARRTSRALASLPPLKTSFYGSTNNEDSISLNMEYSPAPSKPSTAVSVESAPLLNHGIPTSPREYHNFSKAYYEHQDAQQVRGSQPESYSGLRNYYGGRTPQSPIASPSPSNRAHTPLNVELPDPIESDLEEIPTVIPVQLPASSSLDETKGSDDDQDGGNSVSTVQSNINSQCCVLCLKRRKNSCIVDCGHTCFCVPCLRAHVLKHKNLNCPLCQTKITKIVRTQHE